MIFLRRGSSFSFSYFYNYYYLSFSFSSILSEIFITATPLKYEYHRSYNKLHKIIAELGGLINFFTIIFSYLNNFLNEKIFNLKIVYDVFNLEKKKETRIYYIGISFKLDGKKKIKDLNQRKEINEKEAGDD